VFNKFILKIILFISLLFLIDWSLYNSLSLIFQRTQSGETTGGYVNRAKRMKAGVVILGSSRAQSHYNSLILEHSLKRKVYNVGANGQGIPYIRGVIDILLREYTPYLFIINVDEISIATESHLQDFDRVTTLSPFIDESTVIRDMIYSRGIFERIKYLSLSFRYNGKVLAILKNLYEKDDKYLGFTPLEKSLNQQLIMQESHHPYPKASADLDLKRLLREIIRQSQAQGTLVILVNSPWWRQNCKNDPYYSKPSYDLMNIAKEEQVPYVAFTQENSPVFHNPTLFADVAHLNSRGATIFTEMLADWLIKHGYAYSS